MSYSIEANTLDDIMHQVLKDLLAEGAAQESTRGGNVEMIAAKLTLRNPRARLSNTESRRRPVSAIAELCWYLRGSDSAEEIAFWIPNYKNEAEEDGRVHGAYGPRLFGKRENAQVCHIVDMLIEKPGTRRAVIQLFDRRDVAAEVRYKDIPCTSNIQFLLRSNQLHLIVNMRSNDAFIGLPHDVFVFTMLQEIVARQLNVDLGFYTHFVGSLHLYENCRKRAERFLEEGWQSAVPMPPMPDGSQILQLDQMLSAELQLREGCSYDELQLPEEPYWADLVRLLAIHRFRKQEREEIAVIVSQIVDKDLQVFVRASQM